MAKEECVYQTVCLLAPNVNIPTDHVQYNSHNISEALTERIGGTFTFLSLKFSPTQELAASTMHEIY